LQGHNDYVYSVSFSPDGKILASGSWEKSIKLWSNVGDIWTCFATLSGHNGVSFSPDGTTLASKSTDGTIKCWNINLMTFIVRQITLEQSMLLEGIMQAQAADKVFKLIQKNQVYWYKVFYTLPYELCELLVGKDLVIQKFEEDPVFCSIL
jgi:WD40 repeat protein